VINPHFSQFHRRQASDVLHKGWQDAINNDKTKNARVQSKSNRCAND